MPWPHHARPTRARAAVWAVAVVLAVTPAVTAADPGPSRPPVRFDRDVLPILSDRCFPCHGPDAKTRKADLRLDTRDGALGGPSPVVVPGKSGESELVARVASDDPDEVMPPPKLKKPLSPEQVETLRRWVDEGAAWGKHWAFEPPARPEPPAVRNPAWPRNPIDRFVLARLESEGLRPSPEADRATLVRRATLDLTGLPPTPAEVDAFLADDRPGAYERVVDRLLASPRYGERMAWEWLDAARYADSNGYQGDNERTMWPWRDWVVNALNAGMPFDTFTVWQLAGDFLPDPVRTGSKLATGFCRNHMINGEGGRIPEENRVDYVMDMAETAGTVWLGLTFNCCRCHDHKFDPLTNRDYYSLFAFFNQTPVDGGGGNPQTPPVIEAPTPEQAAAREAIRSALREASARVADAEKGMFPRPEGQPASASPKAKGLPAEVVKALDVPATKRGRDQVRALEAHFRKADPAHADRLKAVLAQLDAFDALARAIPKVMVMEDRPTPRDTFLLARGAYDKPGEKVGMAVPAALPALPPDAPRNRLGLARWLVAPDNPLTARVTVNRAWQQFFGTGLVATPEDFGVQGERPSHPGLLDWLAVAFRESGWDVKGLHRRIVTSATYRQSSRVSPALAERDPANRLLARGARFRLPSWMIRDQALAASGLLASRPGGPPVRPYQPAGVWEEATFGKKQYQPDHGESLYRRSVYTFWRRIVGPTEFFDAAPRQVCAVKPTRTNTPLHALTTLNDVTYVEAARALAERAIREGGDTPEGRIGRAFRLVLARRPGAEELAVLRASLDRVSRGFAADPKAATALLSAGESPRDESIDPVEHAAYAAVCSAILNLDEALCKE